MTVIELIEHSCSRLEAADVSFGQGTTNAFDEAAWLVLWRLGLPLDALDDVAEEVVADDRVVCVHEIISERIHTRRPAAYLTGEAWLQGVPFFVDDRTIVPRSLIAEPLMDGSLDAWIKQPLQRVLDLCTGNGSLAVLAALTWPECQVSATDLSPQALEVAARNVDRHGLGARVHLAQGNGLAAVQGRFDLIVCNPPYVNAASMDALPAEFLAEPELALAGGRDGMDFVRALLPRVSGHLSEHGVLVLEIGHEREHFDAAFPRLSPVWLPCSAGDDAVLLLTRETLLS